MVKDQDGRPLSEWEEVQWLHQQAPSGYAYQLDGSAVSSHMMMSSITVGLFESIYRSIEGMEDPFPPLIVDVGGMPQIRGQQSVCSRWKTATPCPAQHIEQLEPCTLE